MLVENCGQNVDKSHVSFYTHLYTVVIHRMFLNAGFKEVGKMRFLIDKLTLLFL